MSYLTASFRGIEFDVLDVSHTAGRRVVVHELPYRDETVTDDLGVAEGPITLTAVIAGAGYAQRRDLLVDALEAPGPGVLIHPTRGRLDVVAEPATVTEANQTVTIALSFRLAGPRPYPTVSADSSVVSDAASAARTALAAAFAAKLDVSGAAHVATSALAKASASVDAFRVAASKPAANAISATGQVTRALARLDSELSELVDTPTDLAEALFDALEPATELAFVRLATASAGAADVTAATTDPAADAIASNETALNRLFTGAALVQYAELAVEEDFQAYDDAVLIRDELAERIYGEARYTTDADAYDALIALRARVVGVLSDLAVELPRLRTVTIDVVGSILELAQGLYGDGERAAEIASRNDIAHPGLLPPGEYRVLDV